MKKIDDKWATLSKTQRLVAVFAAFALVFTLTVIVGKAAMGAPVAQSTSSRRMCVAGGHPELLCWTNAKAARKFRSGYFHHAHGIPMTKIWAHPRRARVTISHRLATWLGHHPKVATTMRQRLHLPATVAGRSPGCTDYCLAWEAYGHMMSSSNCTPTGSINVNPATCLPFSEGPWTKQGVVRGVTVAYCGGTLVLAAAGALTTDGAATPAFATIWGGIGCGWGFLASVMTD